MCACSILVDILPVFFRVIQLCSTTSVPTIPWRCQKQVCLHSLSSNHKVSAEDADRRVCTNRCAVNKQQLQGGYTVLSYTSQRPWRPTMDYDSQEKCAKPIMISLYDKHRLLMKKIKIQDFRKGENKEPSNPETSTEVH